MKKEIINAIKQYETIIIHRHVRPDPDALGSQGGLFQIISGTYPTKRVYVVGEDDETLTYLNEMDTVTDDMYEDALVIVCDTANEERVDDQRYTKGKLLIKIDHHPNETPYGDISWVDTTFSSTSEMIYDLYKTGKEEGLVLNEEGARLLFAGIVGDTGRFQFRSTTSRTFAYASELVEKGIDFPSLYTEMYKMSLGVAKLNGYILQNFTLLNSGAAYMKITADMLKQFGVSMSESSQVVGVLGNIQGIKSWVIFQEDEKAKLIRVRLRSKKTVINKLAQCYNGGGHPLASGATVYSWEEADKLINDLDDICKNN
ncbi:MAG: bifunctional oligoribonuclease/PAP phosphatase NrnA [Bacillaceae bacterium]